MIIGRARRLLVLAAMGLALGAAGWTHVNEAGKAAYARGDYMEAHRLFRQALESAPDEPELHYHLAVTLTHLRRWDEAASAYAKALALRPPPAVAQAARQGLRSVEPLTRARSAPPPEPSAAPMARPKPHRVELPPDTVELRRQRGNWYVDVTLNDLQRATFLVDTGASACVITPELAEAIGIVLDPDLPPVRVQGVAGSASARLGKIASIRVGETVASDVMAFVMALPGMDGILGNTFLSRYTATLHPAERLLTLRPR